MHTFLDNFHQSGKYSAQLASHQAELRRGENFRNQTCLNISSLQTDYLNLDNSVSGSSRHNERAHSVQTRTHFVDLITILWKNVKKKSESKRIKLVLLVLRLKKF